MFSAGLRWPGPVVWWQPVDGWRHALPPEVRPAPGQQRETVCGEQVILLDPTPADWLLPTCDTCMAAAIELGDQRRQQAAQSQPHPWETPAQARARRLQGHP